MGDATNIPAYRVPMIDLRTGELSREWYQFLLVLFNRTGGGTGTDGNKGDITVSDSGNTLSINEGVVATANLGGDITPAGKALLDDLTSAAQRSTLGIDASTVPYSPDAVSNWDGNVDPGEVDGALDQLSRRVTTIEDTETSDPTFVSLVKWGLE